MPNTDKAGGFAVRYGSFGKGKESRKVVDRREEGETDMRLSAGSKGSLSGLVGGCREKNQIRGRATRGAFSFCGGFHIFILYRGAVSAVGLERVERGVWGSTGAMGG